MINGSKEAFHESKNIRLSDLANIPGAYIFCEDSSILGYPIVFMSDRFLTLTGWTREEIVDRFNGRYAEMVHPEDRVEREKRVSDKVYRIQGKDGYIWITGVASYVTIEGKEYVHGSIADITGYVETTQRLKQEQENQLTMLEQQYSLLDSVCQEMGDIFIVDIFENTSKTMKSHGVFLPVEKQIARPYEATWEYYVENYVLEEDREHTLSEMNLKRVMAELAQSTEVNVRYRCVENGEIKVFQAMFRYLGEPRNGKIIMSFRCIDEIIKAEIEEQERLEKQRQKEEAAKLEYARLLKEEMQHSEIIESLTNIFSSMYYVDLKEKTLQRILSQDSVSYVFEAKENGEEAISELIKNFVIPDQQLKIKNFADLDTLNSRLGNNPGLNTEFLDTHGNWRRCTIVPVRRDKDGNHEAVMFTIRIINAEMNALEEALVAAEAANKAKTDFLFNMSHDIRTPMNAIMGFTDILKKNLDNKERLLEYIEKIQNSNEFLLSLINNVLEMARIESGKETVDENIFNITAFSKELTLLFEPQLEQKNMRYIFNCDVEHYDIFTDGTKIREILLNVISNAIKYTPAGGQITLSLKEFPDERPGYGRYQTIIEDTGIGMAKEFLPFIFDEFTREKTSTASRVSGTGLGMPIVKKLVELLQGEITVESELGVGTKFTITLPHRIVHTTDIMLEQAASKEYGRELFEGRRILLAEDNDLNAEIVTLLLEEDGFIVERAEDGIICVDMLERASEDYYDLILMDVQMPNMNGYKATRTIRRLTEPRKANLPIIAMTANAFEEDRRNAFKSGMNAHIAKPIRVDEVKKTLGRILSQESYDAATYRYWLELFKESQTVTDHIKEFEGCPVGSFLYIADGDCNLLMADDEAARIFGCKDFAELYRFAGGSFNNLVLGEDIPRIKSEIATQLIDMEENRSRVQYRIVRKDGSIINTDSVGRKQYFENGKSAFFVVIADISAR